MSNRVLYLLLLSNVFCACWKANDGAVEGPHDVHSVTLGVSQEPDSLFGPFKEMMVSEEVARVGLHTLTIFDEHWKLIPWAAKEIPTLENGLLELYTENGQRKMKTTWNIREDFFWADGKPLVSDDFILGYRVQSDPTLEIPDRTTVEKIERIEKRGPKSFVIVWKEPYAYYFNYRNLDPLPAHVVGPSYRAAPEKLKKSEFGQKPLLAGAFSIAEWSSGEFIRAEKSAYTRSFLKPHLNEIVWRIIPQSNTLESNLVAGDIDAISPGWLDLELALNLQKRMGDQYNFYYTPGLVWEHIDFNLDNPILKDKRVRQALAYGANRAGIAQTLFKGKQPVANSTEPPKSPYYNPNVHRYDFDRKKAAQLLEEAGWHQASPGQIRQKDGHELKLVLMTTAGNKSRERVEQFLQSQWRQIGVEIEIRNQPAKVFFSETLHKRKYPHMAMFSWVKDPVMLSDTLWRCDNIPQKSNGFLGQNLSGFCHPKADEYLKAASKELDFSKRVQIGHKLEELLAEELPSIPLYFRVDVSVTKKGLKNWKPLGILQPVTWNAQQWKWEL